MENMHYLYNVSYFAQLGEVKDVKTADFSAENCKVYNYKFTTANEYLNKLKSAFNENGLLSFGLYTMYPGLLIGTGNLHDVSNNNCIKSGFSFDQMTGLPIIPGSTLKGILRSCFPDYSKKNQTEKAERESFIKELAGKDNFEIKDFLINCFEEDDVYLGAYPVIEKGNECIFAPDNITPHKCATANPIPINILKVKPNVKYEFLFLLKDYVYGENIITAEEKCELFKQMILLNGVGAKTNVGFGQFSDKKSIESGRSRTICNAQQSDNGKQTKSSPDYPKCKCGREIRNKGKDGQYFRYCQTCYSEYKKRMNGK